MDRHRNPTSEIQKRIQLKSSTIQFQSSPNKYTLPSNPFPLRSKSSNTIQVNRANTDQTSGRDKIVRCCIWTTRCAPSTLYVFCLKSQPLVSTVGRTQECSAVRRQVRHKARLLAWPHGQGGGRPLLLAQQCSTTCAGWVGHVQHAWRGRSPGSGKLGASYGQCTSKVGPGGNGGAVVAISGCAATSKGGGAREVRCDSLGANPVGFGLL